MRTKILCLAFACGALLLAFDDNSSVEKRGQDLFVRRCSGCHSPDLDKEGPRLRGVYRRKAASAPGFAYSKAMRKLKFRWDDAQLDRWLQDPESVAPGADMEFRLADPEERTAIIAYLKSLDTRPIRRL